MCIFLQLLIGASLLTAGVLGMAPRGVNTWDALPKSANEGNILAYAAYMRDHLVPYGYDTLTIDGGWYEDASGLVLDPYGRPSPNLALFPSAADGRGLKTLAEKVNAMGVKLGAWTIRGVPAQAVEANLPIWNSTFSARDVAVLDRNCSWDALVLGTNAPSSAADAWYASIGACMRGWVDGGGVALPRGRGGAAPPLFLQPLHPILPPSQHNSTSIMALSTSRSTACGLLLVVASASMKRL